MDLDFKFTKSHKIVFGLLMAIGVATLIWSVLTQTPQRVWADVFLHTIYFLEISLAGVMFWAVHIAGQSGWHTSIQRIPEAMGAFLPAAALLMIIVVAFGSHNIWEWTHEHAGELIEHKRPYLNMPFFIARMAVYFGGWIFLHRKLRALSLKTDVDDGLDAFRKSIRYGVAFVVFFSVTISSSSWDWLMSIDAEWYSTLYGWYVFMSMFVSGIAVIIMLVLFLLSGGYMKHVNKEHLHDLGKYMFGFSIFWMYLWFSQYMLIWYGNLPEETVYFIQRVEQYKFLFYANFVINFFAPFLILLPRRSPRLRWVLFVGAFIVIIGHWIDFYLAVMPGILGENQGIGATEVGLFIGFAGLFLWVVFRALSRAKLAPVNHPFFKESLHYHNL